MCFSVLLFYRLFPLGIYLVTIFFVIVINQTLNKKYKLDLIKRRSKADEKNVLYNIL